MVFTLKIYTDNDAFYENPHLEIGRILREVSAALELGRDFSKNQTLHDIDGNDVGRAAWKEEVK